MVLEFLYFGYSPAKNKLRISQPVSQSASQPVRKKFTAYCVRRLAKIFARAAKTGRRSRGFHDIEKNR